MPLVSTGGRKKSPGGRSKWLLGEVLEENLCGTGERERGKITAEAEGGSWKERWDALTRVESRIAQRVTRASPCTGEAFQAANVPFPPQVVKPSGVHLKLVLRFQDFGKAMFKPMR